MTVFLNKGSLRSESYYFQAIGGENIKIVLHKDQPADLFVQNGSEEIQVRSYNVPKELKQLRQDSNVALLKTAYYSVSYFREGGCKINLHCRLRGGMFDPHGVEESIKVHKIKPYDPNPKYSPPPPEDRGLSSDQTGPNKKIEIIVGFSAVGGVIGLIGGIYGVVIGAGLGGAFGWFVSSKYCSVNMLA